LETRLQPANLINYSADLTNTASFGRPSARFDQIFGQPALGSIGRSNEFQRISEEPAQ
jgi:hypothetical protein